LNSDVINDKPMLPDEALPPELGMRTLLKADCLQRIAFHDVG